MIMIADDKSHDITASDWHRQPNLPLVWLARPSHLIAGTLRAGKGRSSGSND